MRVPSPHPQLCKVQAVMSANPGPPLLPRAPWAPPAETRSLPPLGNMTLETGTGTGTVEGAHCLPSADLPSQGPEPLLRGQQPGRSHRDLDGLALALLGSRPRTQGRLFP